MVLDGWMEEGGVDEAYERFWQVQVQKVLTGLTDSFTWMCVYIIREAAKQAVLASV